MRKEPVNLNPTESRIKGLEANAAMLRASIAQREKRRIGPSDDAAGLATVLAGERASLAQLEKEIEFLKTPETENK